VPSNSYDLVVLGDDLSALVCATLCARRGLRTLVLGDDRPARYQLGPHKLPVEPLLWPSGTGTPAERVLKELHAELALRRKLREPKISGQVVAPDLRLDVGGDRLANELARELGPASEAWLDGWTKGGEVARALDVLVASEHAFPPVGFFEKREVTRLADAAGEAAAQWWKAHQDQPSAALWKHLAAVALRHPAAPPAAIARAIDQWRTGPTAVRGEADALRELLVEKLTTAGGEIRAGKVTEIGLSWGKVSNLTLATGDDIGCGQVVSSRSPRDLAELLGKKAPKRLGELADGLAIVGYRYTLNIVIDEAGLPEHMSPTVAVIAAPDREPTGDASFSIHVSEPDDTGRVVATIAAILASEGPMDPDRMPPQMTALRARLWNKLADVMPFFERHLVLAHSPFEITPPHVPGGRGSYDVPRNLPLPMQPIWKGSLPNTAELGALTYTTGLKNLTLTGDQVMPAMGVEGSLVSGWSAAKVATAIAGKKKDYLRDEIVGATG
jgi:phytoene dehydrogenase-like protein